MERITMREFNQNASKYFNGQSWIITKRGVDFYTIKPVESNVVTTHDVVTIQKKNVVTSKLPKDLPTMINTTHYQSDPFAICSKHKVYRRSCGCK